MQIFLQTLGTPTFEMFQKYDYRTAREVYQFYGTIINCFVSGWREFEAYKVYDYLYGIKIVHILISFLKTNYYLS